MTDTATVTNAPPATGQLTVEVWTDLGCPWCYLGSHRLRHAMNRAGAAGITLMLRSFELDPDASAEPMTIPEILTRKHGLPTQAAMQAEAAMQAQAAAEGLPFSTDRVHANSFDVHRVLQLANRHGAGAVFFETVQKRYFAGETNPYDHTSLTEVAVEVGLDGDEVRAVLASDSYAQQVRRDERRARELGVTGVPFVLLGQRFAVAGAQSIDAYAQAISRARESRS
ncbi:DsbA family oxidoreductase [Micromonospora sp. WMMD712]|uniref:DsbA family oxidoreductase n=1 Tax=Micromonospora sp. WMMD712 TaxID=3016096 RepID=UPI00249B7A15|nr:DsbA family oxidoreductase [Micromonospora sp. WMMD712]WFE55829.1 DsbA family oxidoreductase [Micromonospora sp. WMMD712]